MKLSSPLSVAALVAAALADVQIDWFGEPGCTDTDNFVSSTVVADGDCHNINPVLTNGARLVSCDGQFQCRCTIYLAPNCDSSAGFARINFEDGRSVDCPDLTQDFEFFSANCVHLRRTGSG